MRLTQSLARANRISLGLLASAVALGFASWLPRPEYPSRDALRVLKSLQAAIEAQGQSALKLNRPPMGSQAMLAWATYWALEGSPKSSTLPVQGADFVHPVQRALQRGEYAPIAASPLVDSLVSTDLSGSSFATQPCPLAVPAPASTLEALNRYWKPRCPVRSLDIQDLAVQLKEHLASCRNRDVRPLIYNAIWVSIAQCHKDDPASLRLILNERAGCSRTMVDLRLRLVSLQADLTQDPAAEAKRKVEMEAWKLIIETANPELLGQRLEQAIGTAQHSAAAEAGAVRLFWQELLTGKVLVGASILVLAILQWLLGISQRIARRNVTPDQLAALDTVWFPVDASRGGILVKVLLFSIAPLASAAMAGLRARAGVYAAIPLAVLAAGCGWEFFVWLRLRAALLAARSSFATAAPAASAVIGQPDEVSDLVVELRDGPIITVQVEAPNRTVTAGNVHLPDGLREQVRAFHTGMMSRFQARLARDLNAEGEDSAAPPFTVEQQEQLGELLFRAVFTDERMVSYGVWAAASGRRRLRLRIDTSLSWIPWELLRDPYQKSWLALANDTYLVREILSPVYNQPSVVHEKGLSVLAVGATPSNLPRLDVRREQKILENALTGNGHLQWVDGDAAAVLELLDDVAAGYHVFHFAGHGSFDGQAGVLYWGTQLSQKITVEELSTLLARHRTIRLVVLNSCQGAASGQDASSPSVASALVKRGVPAVLAMQVPILDAMALDAAQTFYRSLTRDVPIDEAVTALRRALDTKKLDWAAPVLMVANAQRPIFVRGPNPEMT